MAKDPVCGMEVPESTAALRTPHQETTYCFCSESCQSQFVQSPERYAERDDGDSATRER